MVPPTSVPTDQPTAAARGPFPVAQSQAPTAMAPTLNSAGASAGAVKRDCAFSMPMATAESETSSRKGIMIRVRKVANSASSGPKPGASSRTMVGAASEAEWHDGAHHDQHPPTSALASR